MTTTITTTEYIYTAVNSMGYDNWWCPCGISPSNVVAAYRAKGVASYSASLVNLANPGTYDAIDDGGASSPGWNTTDGWVGGSGKYLRSDIYPSIDQTTTVIIRFSDMGGPSYICGSKKDLPLAEGYSYYIGDYPMGGNFFIFNGSSEHSVEIAYQTDGVICISGNRVYFNGILQSGELINDGNPQQSAPVNLLGYHLENGAPTNYGEDVKIQAEVWYNVVLTPEQMATVSSAMAAL